MEAPRSLCPASWPCALWKCQRLPRLYLVLFPSCLRGVLLRRASWPWALWKCQRHVCFWQRCSRVSLSRRGLGLKSRPATQQIGGFHYRQTRSTVEVPPLHADKLLSGPLRRGSTAWGACGCARSWRQHAAGSLSQRRCACSRRCLGKVSVCICGPARVGAVRRLWKLHALCVLRLGHGHCGSANATHGCIWFSFLCVSAASFSGVQLGRGRCGSAKDASVSGSVALESRCLGGVSV